MRDVTRQEWIGGNGSHVGDCYVWAEINYLDSATDYREFLSINAPPPTPANGELVMLDDGASLARNILNWFLAACSWLAAI